MELGFLVSVDRFVSFRFVEEVRQMEMELELQRDEVCRTADIGARCPDLDLEA